MAYGMYEKLMTISGYVCNGLFSIGEDGFRTKRRASFCKLFGRYQESEIEFHTIKDYSCTKNAKYKGG